MNDFEAYAQRYAKCNGISVAEAKQHALVKEVKRHYEGNNKNDNVWW